MLASPLVLKRESFTIDSAVKRTATDNHMTFLRCSKLSGLYWRDEDLGKLFGIFFFTEHGRLS